MLATTTALQPDRRAWMGAHNALAAELRRQAQALAAMPDRLRRAAEKDGSIGFQRELRRQANELKTMTWRLQETVAA